MRVTLESGDEAETVKKTICACTDYSHEELKEAVIKHRFNSAADARKQLGWKELDGCAVCRPAMSYYMGVWSEGAEEVLAKPLADGTYSVVPRLYGGVAKAEQLRQIANVIDKYDVPQVKLGADRLELFGIAEERLTAMVSDLGMPVVTASYGRPVTVTSCEGMSYDASALRDSVGMAAALEHRLEGLEMPSSLTVAVSGSPMHRAGTLAKDVGIVGVPGGWEIYVGGHAASTLKQGQLLSIEPLDHAALELAAAFLQAYREQADLGETTWDWIDRVGLVSLRERLFNRAERMGLIERLDSNRENGLSRSIQRQPTAAWGQVN